MFTRQNAKGFTLIELLVVIAIIAMLLAILIPSLSMAKEIARRVICMTQLKGFGTAMYLYSKDYEEKAIPNYSTTDNGGTEYLGGIDSDYPPWQSYVIGDNRGDPDFLMAVNHGKLYGLQYLEEPDLYYCPSAFMVLKGGSGSKYNHDYYFRDIVKDMPPRAGSGWGGPAGDIRCRSSFSYWTWEKTSFNDLVNKPVLIDNLVRIPHQKRGKPFAINALYGDGHTSTTVVANTPEILEYIELDWDGRAKNYGLYVGILKLLEP